MNADGTSIRCLLTGSRMLLCSPLSVACWVTHSMFQSGISVVFLVSAVENVTTCEPFYEGARWFLTPPSEWNYVVLQITCRYHFITVTNVPSLSLSDFFGVCLIGT